jgi:diguanylate cyclase (GGDEF)-like protein
VSFDLADLQKHNSDLLRLLTRHLPDMLWVKDVDGNYLYANEAICEGLLMAKDTNEPIGKNDVFFAMRERETHKDDPHWHTFGELCFNSDQLTIDKNKAMKFEEYGNVKGKLLYLEVFKAPFYNKDGDIVGTVGAGRDITELKKIQLDLQRTLTTLDKQRKQLEYQANHDALTGLPNRILFMDRLHQTLKLANRNKKKVAVMFIDLDHFKEINDSLGHHIGDKILIDFANRIQSMIRKSDSISRLGGDEFCVVINDIENLDNISRFINDGLELVKKPFEIQNNLLHMSMSVGISIYPDDGQDVDMLLKNADAAMYEAKYNGRNTYRFYNRSMTERAFERVFLESALRKALKDDELEVYYQPQIDTSHKKAKIVGMEALVRWNNPNMGLVSPDYFIPLAESTDMIIELDRIVMKKALTQLHKWHADGLNPGKISLNLAIKQLERDDFIEFLKELVSSRECSYNNIEFEVTESQIMKNPERSIETLKKINELGISIAVDDFGTGYSSLAYLKKLPITKLKIDKSFIDELPKDTEDVAITKTVISLCQNLNLKVIAEGVETVEQKDFLLQNGCKFVQGYLYSKPLNVEDMTQFLKDSC